MRPYNQGNSATKVIAKYLRQTNTPLLSVLKIRTVVIIGL